MLEVLTPLSKCIRVTRPIDPETFVAAPGFFAWVDTDGSLKDQVTDTVKPINKLVMTSATDNIYESHDIESGRITTLEDHADLQAGALDVILQLHEFTLQTDELRFVDRLLQTLRTRGRPVGSRRIGTHWLNFPFRIRSASISSTSRAPESTISVSGTKLSDMSRSS